MQVVIGHHVGHTQAEHVQGFGQDFPKTTGIWAWSWNLSTNLSKIYDLGIVSTQQKLSLLPFCPSELAPECTKIVPVHFCPNLINGTGCLKKFASFLCLVSTIDISIPYFSFISRNQRLESLSYDAYTTWYTRAFITSTQTHLWHCWSHEKIIISDTAIQHPSSNTFQSPFPMAHTPPATFLPITNVQVRHISYSQPSTGISTTNWNQLHSLTLPSK